MLSTYPAEGSQNVGDALITESFHTLLRTVKGDVEFTEVFREEPLSELDGPWTAILLPGFALRHQTWPRIYPLRDDLSSVDAPIIPIGAGAKFSGVPYLRSPDASLDWNTRELLTKISDDVPVIAARDDFTHAVLAHHKLASTVVGDCALFDPRLIGQQPTPPDDVRHISFTAPRRPDLVDQAIELVDMLHDMFPNVEVRIYRHGIPGPTEKEVEHELGLATVDLFGRDVSSLRAHDEVDLHVGYRLHAHLYRLRTRSPSILLQEDSRAVGFAQTLALEGVPAFADMPPHTSLFARAARRLGVDVPVQTPNPRGVAQVRDIISRMIQSKFEEVERACHLIDWYYGHRMIPYLERFP